MDISRAVEYSPTELEIYTLASDSQSPWPNLRVINSDVPFPGMVIVQDRSAAFVRGSKGSRIET